MTDFAGVFTLAAAAVVLAIYALRTPNGAINYLFLVAALVLGWMVPQAIGLLGDPAMPAGALGKACTFGALCLLAALVGYVHGQRGTFRSIDWNLDNRLLGWMSILLSVVGGLFYLEVRKRAEAASELYSGQWTGTITIYYFFSRLMTFGLILAVIGYIQKPTKAWFLIILVDSLFYVDRIVFHGRRTELFELALACVTFLWLYKRIAIPRLVAIVAVVAATLAVYSAGDYRTAVQFKDRIDWSEVRDIDVIGTFRDVLANGGEEMRNAALSIEGTDRVKSFDYGLSLWNMLVFQYVPGQLLGSDEKESLYVELPDPAFTEFGHIPYTGTTLTGFSDAFASFWYFGFIKFYLIAFIIGRLYRSAFGGNVVASVLLIVLLTPALLAFTHSTSWFIKDIPQIAAFLLLPLWYARLWHFGEAPRPVLSEEEGARLAP